MAETAAERYARTGDGSPETEAETYERLRRAKEKGPPQKPTGEGLTQQQKEAADAQWRKDQQEYINATDPKAGVGGHGAESDGSDANAQGGTVYHSPGAAEVGGYVGGAKDQQAMYQSHQGDNDAAQAANHAAMQGSLAAMNGDRGTVSPENAQLLARQDAARMQQGNALDLSRDAAMGNAPSAANAQMAMAMNENMAGQSGAAGAARGLSALSGAQATGAAGVGMAGTQAALAGGMGRSKEIGDAMGMYGGAAGNMATADMNRLGQGDKNALGNQQLNDSWTEGNAGLAANQGKLGLSQASSDDAWYNQGDDAIKRQMSYDSRMNAIENGANADAADAASAKRRADEDRNRQLIGGGVQAGLTLGGTAVGGPAGGAGGGVVGGMANSYISNRKNF